MRCPEQLQAHDNDGHDSEGKKLEHVVHHLEQGTARMDVHVSDKQLSQTSQRPVLK